MNPLRIENLSFSYNGHKALSELSLEIESGKVTTILGPNGSGKTTLLKLILGLLSPLSGQIFLYDKPLSDYSFKERAKKLAYVPQKHIPAFSYKVSEVVEMGRHPHGSLFSRISSEDIQAALESMKRLGIENLKDRPYTAISGGEQQLVLIARALAQNAQILVMDEPVSGLDYGNQIKLLEQLQILANDGITCLTTSHFPEHALWTADRAIFLKAGKLVAQGPSHEVINTSNLRMLYNTEIKIVTANNAKGEIKTCVPEIL
jgi:iron complex transport system ATP-binding protein